MSNEAQKSEVAIVDAKPVRQIVVVQDPIHILDTGRFEHLQRIATVMARCNLIPDGLCVEGSGNDRKYLPEQTIIANCFLVVNQAVRWGMDPFAVAQCVSVVHGKLCYEGKLIAAVLEAKLGVQLEYEIKGDGDAMNIVVSAAVDGQPVVDSKNRPKIVYGTVADWKTTGTGSPWAARGGLPRMLRYRGAREWARVHAPGLMLGVYSDDEMETLSDDARANRARNVTPIEDARQARQDAQIDRPKPPDPNAAPARPRPPNPMGDAERPTLDIPKNLDRADPNLKDTLLAEIKALVEAADCFAYAQGIEKKIVPLNSAERTEVRKAYIARQQELVGD